LKHLQKLKLFLTNNKTNNKTAVLYLVDMDSGESAIDSSVHSNN